MQYINHFPLPTMYKLDGMKCEHAQQSTAMLNTTTVVMSSSGILFRCTHLKIMLSITSNFLKRIKVTCSYCRTAKICICSVLVG